MRKCILLLALLFARAPVGAQPDPLPAVPENYARVMAWAAPTPAQVDTMLKVCYGYFFTNADSAVLIAERAVAIGERRFRGDTIHAEALLYLGDAYTFRGDWAEAKQALLAGRRMCQDLGQETRVAAADLKLGALHIRIEDYELALEYDLRALDTWEKLRDSVNLYRPYFQIAEVFYLLNQPEKALEYNDRALRWGEATESPAIIMSALNNQGLIEKYLADDFRSRADTSTSAASVLSDSARYYQNRALATMSRSLELTRPTNNLRPIAELLLNLSELRADRGELTQALALAEEGAVLAERINSGDLLLGLRRRLAKIYRLTGQPLLAIQNGEAGLALPAAAENAAIANQVEEELYLANKMLGRFAEALRHHETYTAFVARNEAVERNEVVAAVEAKFQTLRKEKRILELDTANAALKRQKSIGMVVALLLILFGFIGFSLNRIREERNQKIRFTDALIDAQEEERKRIARDLHDGIGQSLLVIGRQLDNTEYSVRQNKELVSATLQEVRAISRDLHPLLLEKFGLSLALREMVDNVVAHEPELFISSEIDDIDGLLSTKAELQVFRTLQEALSNIVKHARATAVKVSARETGKHVEVIIRDNGRGFNHAGVLATSRSLGLRTMQERIAAVKGKFTITSGAGKGTELSLTIPKT